MKGKKISLSKININVTDIKKCLKVIKSGWLVNGPVVKDLEEAFCKYTGAQYAVAMNSCTAALHAACAYLKIVKHKKILKVPDITHVASAHSVIMAGLKLKIADVDPIDGIILPKYIDGNEIIVHLAGQPCNKIKNNTIEDCAHALGTRYSNGKHVGTMGLCGCFSFYPTKHITCAEGGMLITNNKNLYEFAKNFRAFGITSPPEKRKRPADYDCIQVSPNYRMPDLLAALLIGQLARIEKNIKHRQKIAEIYQKELDGTVILPTGKIGTSWFFYQIQLDERDELIKYLSDKGIQTSIHYRTPISEMTVYKSYRTGSNAAEFSRRVISLPVHSGITKNDAKYIALMIKKYVNSIRKNN